MAQVLFARGGRRMTATPLDQLIEVGALMRTMPAGVAPSTAIAISNRINRYIDGYSADPTLCVSLDSAFELKPAAGGDDPRAARQVAEHYEWLCVAAAHMPGPTNSERAGQLHRSLDLYFCGADWRSQRVLDLCPHQPGTLRAAMWQALKKRPQIASPRTLRRILSRGR